MKCNKTAALVCHHSTLLRNDVCVECNTVTGFRLTSNGNCNEICGDGVVLKYQCDDGNRINGDGCSSNCLIENGWTCVKNATNGSNCTLTGTLTMTLTRVHKYPRQNSILLVLAINIDLNLNNNNFALTIQGLDTAYYTVTVLPQKANNLKKVACKVDYLQSIAKKKIQLDYNSTARRRLLLDLNEDIVF